MNNNQSDMKLKRNQIIFHIIHDSLHIVLVTSGNLTPFKYMIRHTSGVSVSRKINSHSVILSLLMRNIECYAHLSILILDYILDVCNHITFFNMITLFNIISVRLLIEHIDWLTFQQLSITSLT